MDKAIINLKMIKLLFIEMILIVLYFVFLDILPTVNNDKFMIFSTMFYIIPIVWITYGLFKNGSSIKEWFKPIKLKKTKIIITILMPFLLLYSMILMTYLLKPTLVHYYNVSTVICIINVLIIGPIAEEMFFRGYVFNLIKIKTNVKEAIIISSLIFGVLHVGSELYSVLAGFILALIYTKYKNLFLSIIIHVMHNGIFIFPEFFINKDILEFPFTNIILGVSILFFTISSIWFIRFIIFLFKEIKG